MTIKYIKDESHSLFITLKTAIVVYSIKHNVTNLMNRMNRLVVKKIIALFSFVISTKYLDYINIIT